MSGDTGQGALGRCHDTAAHALRTTSVTTTNVYSGPTPTEAQGIWSDVIDTTTGSIRTVSV